MDGDKFRIVGPEGEEGPLVEYGPEGEPDVAFLAIGEEVYFCRVDDPDAETQRVECVTQTKLMPTAIEDTKFVDDEEEEDEDGGDDDDGEEVAEIEEEEPAA